MIFKIIIFNECNEHFLKAKYDSCVGFPYWLKNLKLDWIDFLQYGL